MHLIVDICKQTDLSSDDVCLILADVRQDWATTESVTEPEYQLIFFAFLKISKVIA